MSSIKKQAASLGLIIALAACLTCGNQGWATDNLSQSTTLHGFIPTGIISSVLDDIPECEDSDGDGECDVNPPSE